MRILLVEDDTTIALLVSKVLQQQHYTVDVATDGQLGWEMAHSVDYDLIVSDVMLPKLDGITLCRRLRQQSNSIPLILLTTRSATEDRITGLDAGADDYVVKPFDPAILSARIRALLRRGETVVTSVLQWGQLQLDPAQREVRYGTQLLNFSRREYQVLELLLNQPRQVFDRGRIVDQIYAFDEDPPTEETVKSYIKTIRRKLRAVQAEDIIETLYGQGYRLNPVYEAMSAPTADPEPASNQATANPEGPTTQQQLDATVAKIWQRAKGTTVQRLDDLAACLAAIAVEPTAIEAWEQAVRLAHKLAGSLGTFGFEQGSLIAQQLEYQLEQRTETPDGLAQAQQLNHQLRVVLGDLDTSQQRPAAGAESDQAATTPATL
ncbi:MAG: response regulator, partial [Cyanobacteria bacterium P01_H01_bin.121]